MMSVRRLGLAVLTSLCASSGVLALSAPVMALNVHVFSGSFGGEGSENGKLKEPLGIAVNDTTHNVYVADRENARIEEFTSAGAYVGQFAPPGGFGVGRSSFEQAPLALAVDNSGNPLDPSAGDVYAIDGASKVVDKFSETGAYEGQIATGEGGAPLSLPIGVAVDPTGVVWVSERSEEVGGTYIESFSDAQINVFRSKRLDNASLIGLAVDSEGRLYIQGSGLVEQLEPSGEFHDFGNGTGGVAVDTSNNEVYHGEGTLVTAYDDERRSKEEFGSGDLTENGGIAVDSATHTVYVTDSVSDRVLVFGQVVVPDVETGEEPTNVTHEGSVTLDGTVNPDGIPVGGCQFEYGTEKSYGNTIPCEPSPGSGSGVVAVHADVSGLTPLTRYHYRLVASNTNGSNVGIDRTFIAPAQAKMDGESVSNVASGSATFSGQVNPDGSDTTYRFEYGLSASYGESISGEAGGGLEDVGVAAHPQDLRPGTAYHYRLVVESALGTVTGEDRVFITQSAVSVAGLPDGRAWEMVSPPNKQGASLLPIGTGGVIQAAANGSAISYDATGPTEEQPPGDRSPERVQIFSTLTPAGWVTKVIATPHDATHTGLLAGHESEYELFSSDLSIGSVEPLGSLALSGEASEQTPYLRHDATCEVSPTVCYQPLVTSANVAAGVKFGGQLVEQATGEARFAGATPDLSHIILSSGVALTADGSPGLYEWAGGKLTFIADMQFGYKNTTVAHAVSDDGSRVIGEVEERELFMRDIPEKRTFRLDVTEPGALGGRGQPAFETASSNGSRVFFMDSAPLTPDSTASYGLRFRDLYEFNLDTGKVSDLSKVSNIGERADVLGSVLGASEDGSYVYFVANGVLAAGASPGNCQSGSTGATCSLYVSHNGATTFIAELSQDDANVFATASAQVARVSPNGQWLAFMSDRDLTGYDSRDAYSGKPDEEIYLYHANPEAGGKHLVCASCNPTGGRPAGAFMLDETIANGIPTALVSGARNWQNRWLAATIPAWGTPEGDKALYQSRYLSDSGRLFFNSNDPLTAQDTNGTWDVYEYEPSGVGSCESVAATFVSASSGCVDLISSGGGHEESVLLDVSETGDDVFFLTGAGLVNQDYDGALDIYDAHVCSAGAPCLPASAVSPPPCSTGDSCKAAPSPQPEIFGAPSSETFSGAGNVTPGAGSSGVVSRSLTGRQKLAQALKACKKKRSKRKRAVCERQARKRYAKQAVVGLRNGKSVSSRTGR